MQTVIDSTNPYIEAPRSPADLHSLFNRRAIHHADKHNAMDSLTAVYNGHIPDEFSDFFHEEQHVHVVNMVRLAWDDHAMLTAQEFPLFSEPDNNSAEAKKKAEKREAICYGYNAAGRKAGAVDMQGLMLVLAHHLVGFAEAVAVAYPDYRRQTPFMTFRDPRTHFAPIGWSPWEQGDLDGTMFAYRMTLGDVKRRFGTDKDGKPNTIGAELNRKYRKSIHSMTTGWKGGVYMMGGESGFIDDDEREVWVGEYYSKDAWYVATMEDEVVILAASEQGDKDHPGVCPAVGFSLYNTGQPRSMLSDQVSIQAAMSRMFSQKLDYYDKTLYPLIFGSRIVGGRPKYGPNAYNQFEEGLHPPRLDVVAPQNSVDADQMMGFAMGLQRMLNRNPEAMQGGGDANSAKALNELKSGVTSTIQNGFWPTFFQGLPQLYSKAMRIDINLWGKEQKKISGRTPSSHRSMRSQVVGAKYRPNELLGYEDSIEIEAGIELRGYEGRLEVMQLFGSGLMSMDTALEQLDIVREPQAEKRRLSVDQLEKAWFADIIKKADGGLLHPEAWPVLRDAIESKEDDLFAAAARLEKEGKFLLPPPEEIPMPPGSEPTGPPGMDAIAAMAGSLEAGGIPGEGGPPALSMIRGAA